MAYQLSDIITRVQRRLRDPSYSPDELTDYLNDTINDICNEYRLPFMLATHTYTVTANNSDITAGTGLPADYVQAFDLLDTTSGQQSLIEIKDVREIDQLFASPDDTSLNAVGQPRYAYFYGETIRLFPVPDKAYTFILRYYKKPTDLVNDGDIPLIPSQYIELLIAGATYRTMQVKDDYDSASVFENKYAELLQKMVVKENQQQVGKPAVMRINRTRLPHASSWKGRYL